MKRGRGTNQGGPPDDKGVSDACWEAEKAAAVALTEETKTWFEGVLAERARQNDARDREYELIRSGAFAADALQAAQARWVVEDAAWDAASQEFDRRRAEFRLMTTAAMARRRRELEKLRSADGRARRQAESEGRDDQEFPQ